MGLRRPAQLKQPPGARRQISESISLPAPVGGWNARDPIAAMNPADAIQMENWFPTAEDIRLRKGYSEYETGIGDQVESLMVHNAANGTETMFAAADTVFYDVSTQGAVPLAVGNVGGAKFDGSSYLDGSALTGISDGKTGTIVIFARFDGTASGTEVLVGSTGDAFRVYRTSGGAFVVSGENSGGTEILNLTSTASYSAAGTYIIMASWDLTSAGQLYIDQSSDLDSSTITNDTIDYTVTEYSIGADADGSNKFTGDYYLVWFDPTGDIDFSMSANREKFADSNDNPVSLGDNGETPTSSSPILYLGDNDFDDWPTNRGTGTGAFTENGTLSGPDTLLFKSDAVHTNARWQHVNFTNSSGTAYLCCFNGTDNPQYYDGTDWISITGTSTPAITGVTSSDLDNPWIHKRRMWLLENNTLSAWYLPVDAVGGAASEFDLAGLFSKGGSLVAGGTWTIDAGSGLDDYWVVITSEGEVAVYQGTDPSSASTWTIQGIWQIGEPIGNRCFMKYAGDLLVICRDGVYPLSLALQSSQVTPNVAVTDKIRSAVAEATTNYKSNFGWELLHYPGGEMIMLNVPVNEGSDQEQYVMNTTTKAWGHFKDVSANCWAIFGNEPYFGGNGMVYKFWDSLSDNGMQINGDVKQAFNYFGDRSGLKQWTMIRPIFRATTSPNIQLTVNTDYGDEDPTSSLSFSSPNYATWDNAAWDSGVWGGGLITLTDWQSVSEYGTTAALRMKLSATGIEVRFQAADYVFERGAVI